MRKVVPLRDTSSASGRFEALLEPHFGVLYGAARRLAASAEDAEDLVQEVCIRAYRHRAALADMEYPRAWLLKTLYNRFIDDERRRRRSPRGSTTTGDEGAAALPGPARLEPEREAERLSNTEAIHEAMRRLGREQRTLLSMHDIDGLTLEEIRGATGLPAGTIKSKLHRARVKLGRLLARLDPEAVRVTRTGARR